MTRSYGWRRGLPSLRYPQLSLPTFPALSPAKDLATTGFLPPIWDQGQAGSCTGHGTTRAIMYARAKQGLPLVDLSRLFPYWNGRAAEGSTASDSGAVIADVIAGSQAFGDCPYPDWPTTEPVTTRPSPQAFTDALQHKSLGATRVMGSTEASLEYHFKHCIDVLGLPIVIGITVYESFESDAVAKSGIVPMPAATEKVLGGHCIVARAYDDATQMVGCDNSWGTAWGLAGRFWLPYAYVFNPGLADDFHAVTLEA